MDYCEEVLQLSLSVLRLMKSEKLGQAQAFSKAFRNSDFDPEIYHQVRIGMKSFFRSWREKNKKKPERQDNLPFSSASVVR